MSATTEPQTVTPTGTLKQLLLKDIKIGERFRKDFSDDEAFVESVREKGILQPITVDKSFQLLAGERRFRAAQKVGLEKIPALVRQVEGEVDAREIELIENTFRKDFTWQERCNLTAEIDRLYQEKSFDWSGRKTALLLAKSTMSVARDLELARAMTVLPELATEATASDAYKMLKKFEESVIVGELRNRQVNEYQELNLDGGSSGHATTDLLPRLGAFTPDLKARLRIADSNYHIGDAFTGLAELRSEGVVHIIECDPPYGIELAKNKASKDSVDSTVHGYEEVPTDQYQEFLTKLSSELFRVAGKDCWLIFWYGPTWHHEVKSALADAGWKVDDIPAIWIKEKGQTLQPETYLARGYEPFFVCRKGSPYMAKRGRLNWFQYFGTPSNEKYHPTERPLNLIEEILNTFGVARQVVLVPFLGSGATLRACYKLGLSAFGWDLNGAYKDRFMLAVESDFKAVPDPDENTDEPTEETAGLG